MALPLLEEVRVLCSDIERRRLAVANSLSTVTTGGGGGASSNNDATNQQEKVSEDGAPTANKHNKDGSSSTKLHEGVTLVRDHFILRQSHTVRSSADAVLDLLDSPEFEVLANQFVASRDPANQRNAQVAAQRALDSFDLSAAHMREYHRKYPKAPFELPQLERPNERDVDKVRTTLFTGPERKGKAVDLTVAYRHFSDFLHKSSTETGGGASLLVVRDINIPYPAFVSDPIGACCQVSAARKTSSSEAARDAYETCLISAVSSLEQFISKTKPLTCEAELTDIQQRVATVMQQVKRASGSSSNSTNSNSNATTATTAQIRLESLNSRIRDSWKDVDQKVAAVFTVRGDTSSSSGTALAEKKNRVLHILELEEKLVQLSEIGVGENVLASSGDHLKRVTLRTSAEEAQDAEDDDLKFQEDFFVSFYAKPPLSDTVGLTITDNSSMLEMTKSMMMSSSKNVTAAAAARAAGGGVGSSSSTGGDIANKDDDDDEEKSATERNLKNFPLDALGNPIPVWLYKLHGLGKKFFCEVCGYAYAGEKIYTQHFTEPRHERGLERLGIKLTPQNASAFRLIPTREGALQAHRKLQEGDEQVRRRYRGDDVEVEDATGNVATVAQLRSY